MNFNHYKLWWSSCYNKNRIKNLLSQMSQMWFLFPENFSLVLTLWKWGLLSSLFWSLFFRLALKVGKKTRKYFETMQRLKQWRVYKVDGDTLVFGRSSPTFVQCERGHWSIEKKRRRRRRRTRSWVSHGRCFRHTQKRFISSVVVWGVCRKSI